MGQWGVRFLDILLKTRQQDPPGFTRRCRYNLTLIVFDFLGAHPQDTNVIRHTTGEAEFWPCFIWTESSVLGPTFTTTPRHRLLFALAEASARGSTTSWLYERRRPHLPLEQSK
jgi:hypothetical protein